MFNLEMMINSEDQEFYCVECFKKYVSEKIQEFLKKTIEESPEYDILDDLKKEIEDLSEKWHALYDEPEGPRDLECDGGCGYVFNETSSDTPLEQEEMLDFLRSGEYEEDVIELAEIYDDFPVSVDDLISTLDEDDLSDDNVDSFDYVELNYTQSYRIYKKEGKYFSDTRNNVSNEIETEEISRAQYCLDIVTLY